MSNSKLISHTNISPNSNNPRNHMIDKITIHHMAGNASIETCGRIFADPNRQASSNYGVGTDGRIALYVDEANRAWTSSNAENDHRAVTIEVANDGGDPDWHVSDKALQATIDLCVDICQRNGIKKLNFTGNKTGNLTMHKWFAATGCPGPYLESKFPYIAAEVNKRLGVVEKSDIIYRVQVGAFQNKAGAEALCTKIKAAGFSAFVTTSEPSKTEAIKKGDTVMLKTGATTYTGGSLASFVYNRKHVVTELQGDRAVISFGGVVVAAVKVDDLVKT